MSLSVRTLTLLLTLLTAATPAFAATLDDSLSVVNQTSQQGIDAQAHIDKLAIQTQRMLEEYQQILRQRDYQDAYNAELSQLAVEQQTEIDSLNQQLDELKVTQMQIMPLMRTMADALEQFVVLDLPFHQDQRVAGVLQLRQRLRSSTLSLPEKFRLLLEAYQIENDYSQSLEAYRAPLQLEDQKLSVEYLRVGRVALYYRSLDGSRAGVWDGQARHWHPLDNKQSATLNRAIRIATNLQAPELLSLPMNFPGSSQLQQEVQP